MAVIADVLGAVDDLGVMLGSIFLAFAILITPRYARTPLIAIAALQVATQITGTLLYQTMSPELLGSVGRALAIAVAFGMLAVAAHRPKDAQ